MKRYDLVFYRDAQFPYAEVKERERGKYIEYEDAARIIAQRDRLAEVVNNWIAACDGPEFAVLRAASRVALAELDKEKQS